MLQISNRVRPQASRGDGEDSLTEKLVEIRSFLRRELGLIAITVGVCITLAVLYLMLTPPSYTAVTTLVIDTRKVQLFQQQSLFNETPVDAGTVETQVEILKSENIALKVIKDLHLADDPEFGGAAPGMIGSVLNWIFGSSTAAPTESAQTREAVRAFQGRLGVRRVGLTYVMEVSFRSLDRDRAAEIANAVANAYVVDQLEAKYLAARRAGLWLQDRLRELREQAGAAERAVVEYKNSNELIDAGGRLINEQQLAELNSQLLVARGQTAEAQAKLDRITSVLESNSVADSAVATVTDTLKNDVITKLRSKYLDLSALEADVSRRYGPGHLAAVNMRNQMKEIENSIRNELQRIAESYKSEVQIAKLRQESLQKQLDGVIVQSQTKNEAQVKLRELESNSQSYRALYDNFLQRYMESVQQQSFPITEARIISAASRPLGKSHPKTMLVLAFSVFAGLGLGIGIGAWRGIFDNSFRTSKQVEHLLQADCIAVVPRLGDENGKVSAANAKWSLGAGAAALGGMARAAGARADLPGFTQRDLSSAILTAPFSPVAEGVRSIKVAIDHQSNVMGGKIVGVTSSIAGEGKSSISSALATLVSQAGARTILIDCDLRNPSLSRVLAPDAKCGLLELLEGRESLDAVLKVDPETGVKFLPVAAGDHLSNSSELLTSKAMQTLFTRLRSLADYIIVDLPPVAPIVDVRAASNLVDSYVFVVEWGKTKVDVVQQALHVAKGIQDRLVGVVLNKADIGWLEKFEGYSSGYYRHEFARYGANG